MKVIKPLTLSVLHRAFEFRREFHLGVAVLSFWPVEQAPRLLKEAAMWPFLAAALPGQSVDAAMPKARAEFLAAATAFAPGGRAVTRLRAGIILGERKKLIQIVGPRAWDGRRATPPAPFTAMEIAWEQTYGGAGFADNPAGLGFAAAAATVPAPAALPTVLPYAEHDQDYKHPVSFGAVDLTGPARKSLAGTHDAAWLKNDFPGLARDIDWRFFNIAPPDQQFDRFLTGDEAYAFENLHPEQPLIQGRLPGLAPRAFIDREEPDGFTEIPLALTTVWFFPAALRLVTVHHGRAPLRHELAADVARLVVGAERLGAPARLAAYFKDIMSRRMEKTKEGMAAALRDADLVPPEFLAADPSDAQAAVMPGAELGLQRARRRMEREYEAARRKMIENGVNPDEQNLPPLPPEERMPTLDELPARFETLQAEAEAHRRDAEEKAAKAEAELDAQLLKMGKSEAEVARMREARHAKPKGPPAFSTDAMLAQLNEQAARKRALNLDTKDIDEILGDADKQAEWRQAEGRLAETYLLSAHFQDAAEALDDAASAAVRARLAAPDGGPWRHVNFCGAALAGIELSGRDLAGIWLDGADLTGAALVQTVLREAVLAHAGLERARLDGADLTGANLGGARLAGASLQGAKLAGAVLREADLRGADFSGADVTGADLSGAQVEGASFSGAAAPGLSLLETSFAGFQARGMMLDQAAFVGVDFCGADFSGASLHRASFVNCRLEDADFSGAKMFKTCFVGTCEAKGANFSGADLRQINLRGAGLRGAIFTRAEMPGADLSDAELGHAIFIHANLANARLSDAKLRGAILRQSNFKQADLARADLSGADLRDCSFYEANLARAVTDGATRVGGAQTTRLRYLPLHGAK
jgi:uncharacterized protein YjbI with pentapeptide repeats